MKPSIVREFAIGTDSGTVMFTVEKHHIPTGFLKKAMYSIKVCKKGESYLYLRSPTHSLVIGSIKEEYVKSIKNSTVYVGYPEGSNIEGEQIPKAP